jgi:hypothetical protein
VFKRTGLTPENDKILAFRAGGRDEEPLGVSDAAKQAGIVVPQQADT